jgi:hypothetical protein
MNRGFESRQGVECYFFFKRIMLWVDVAALGTYGQCLCAKCQLNKTSDDGRTSHQTRELVIVGSNPCQGVRSLFPLHGFVYKVGNLLSRNFSVTRWTFFIFLFCIVLQILFCNLCTMSPSIARASKLLQVSTIRTLGFNCIIFVVCEEKLVCLPNRVTWLGVFSPNERWFTLGSY